METTMRSLARRSLQSLVAASFLVVLTGCPDGDGGGGTGGGEPPPPPACEPGFHLETICDDVCNGGCHDECVPDEQQCPDGTEPVFTCAAQDMPVCQGEGCPEPPPDQCWFECVPVDECGPGWHTEWVCEPQPEPLPGGGDDGVAPPEECWPTCVPDEPYCPPGSHPEEVCYTEGGDAIWCQVECVPDAECPPDTVPVEVCADDPSDPAEPLTCWIECQPVCGYGYHHEPVCEDGEDGQYCYEQCVPDDPMCPPGTHAEEVCYEEGDAIWCQLECVADGEPEPM